MDLEKAIEFVMENGTQFDRAKLGHTLGMGFDAAEVLEGFSSMQNPDGGFPYNDRKGFPSCLSNTTAALQELVGMGLGGSGPACRGIEYLESMRSEQGTWDENPKVKPLDPPPWDMPGNRDTAIWLTAAAADALLRAGHHVPDGTFDFLKGLQGPDGRFDGFCHTTWIALSVFGPGGRQDGHVFSGALAYLEAADVSEWEISCMAWCLDCMVNGRVTIESPLWERLMGALSETQDTDGSWPSRGDKRMRAGDANAVLAVAAAYYG